MRRARFLLLVAFGSIVSLALLYVAARGTSLGLRIDRSAIELGLTEVRAPRIHDATSDVLRTIDVSSLALLGGGMVVLALLRGRVGHALAVVAILAGANVTTQVLKPRLPDADVPGVDPADLTGASFPSGHATVAMSLALAAVIAVPAALRGLAALAGAAYAAAVGVALVALGWHYPSDVAGGYLVSTAWTALVAAGLVASARRATVTSGAKVVSRAGIAALGALVAAAFVAVVALAVSRRPELELYGRLHTAFFVSSAALAGVSLALAAGIAVLLDRPAPRL